MYFLESVLEDQTLKPLEVHAQTELELRAAEVGNHVVSVLQRKLTDGQVKLGGVILEEHLVEFARGIVLSLGRVELGNEIELRAGG